MHFSLQSCPLSRTNFTTAYCTPVKPQCFPPNTSQKTPPHGIAHGSHENQRVPVATTVSCCLIVAPIVWITMTFICGSALHFKISKKLSL